MLKVRANHTCFWMVLSIPGCVSTCAKVAPVDGSDCMHCGIRDELSEKPRKAIAPREPASGRRQHLLSPIFFPIEDTFPRPPHQ